MINNLIFLIIFLILSSATVDSEQSESCDAGSGKASTYLSQDQISAYHRDGYLVIENYIDSEKVTCLRNKIHELVQKEDLTNVKSIFSTKENMRRSDDYFLNSGHQVRYFWEERAWVNGSLTKPIEKSINKIGHALHDLIEEFYNISYDKRNAMLCHELGFLNPFVVQSMYIFKQPYIGGEVTPHQDGAFLYTEPQSVIGFWWALDDCTLENGALWAVPGSHKTVPVSRRFRRKPGGNGTEFVPPEPVQFSIENAVPLIIPRGSLVLLHHSLVHYSLENNSPHPRHAYSIHVVEKGRNVVYPEDNWLQRPNGMPFQELSAEVTAKLQTLIQ